MANFVEANRVRLSLKMKLSQYCWYNSSILLIEGDSYYVSIGVSKINNQIRKLIPPLINGVSVRTNVE